MQRGEKEVTRKIIIKKGWFSLYLAFKGILEMGFAITVSFLAKSFLSGLRRVEIFVICIRNDIAGC